MRKKIIKNAQVVNEGKITTCDVLLVAERIEKIASQITDHQEKISLEKIVEKTSHNVAEIYRMIDRGYIREGYFADLVLVDLNNHWKVNSDNNLYKCGWSPFENQTFKSKILKTFVNGNLVHDAGVFDESFKGHRLKFSKIR